MGYSLAVLAFFTAVGSGPAIALLRDWRIRIAAAPIIGFALCASLLTSASLFIPLRTATWIILVPFSALSLGVAAWCSRRRPAETGGRVRELVIPLAVILVGVGVALAPALAKGSPGPFGLAVYDAWGYSATSVFLQDHSARETLPAKSARADVTAAYGSGYANGYARIGVDSVNASAATLLRASPGATIAPLLAALFGLIPIGIWLILRGLGGSFLTACLGALLGLSPAMLSLVEDSALGNLAGEILIAPTLYFIARSLRRSLADAIVSGILLAGLVAVYPEFLGPLLMIAAIGGVVFALDRSLPGDLRARAGLIGSNAVVAGATALVLAPYAWYRAFHYLSDRGSDGPWSMGLPVRSIDVQNAGAWAFGLLHLYQLPGFDGFSPLKLAFATYFPVLLAGVVVLGIALRFRLLSVFVATPIVVATALGIYGYTHFQAGRCEYCLWKSLTFMLPFLTIGLALGIERLWRRDKRKGVVTARAAASVVVVVVIIAIGYSNSRLVDRMEAFGAFYSCNLCELSDRLDGISSRSPLLIEGVGSMPQSQFAMPATYFAVRGHKPTPFFDAGFPAVQYLGLTTESAAPYYTHDYEYVVTPFTDMRSNRTRLGRFGNLALERRAPIDIVVSTPDWVVDGVAPLIPWVSSPFRLRVSSSQATAAAITLSLERPADRRSTLSFSLGGKRLETVSTQPSELCVNANLRKGETTIDAAPILDPLPAPRSWQLWKELGLAAIKAEPGRCGSGEVTQPVSLADGWFPVEQLPDGSIFRWMGSTGLMKVGSPGISRSRVRISMQLQSFQRPRSLTVWLEGTRLTSVTATPSSKTELTVVVPPGKGVAELLFVASPAAESASVVAPGDPRLLSLTFRSITVQIDQPRSR